MEAGATGVVRCTTRHLHACGIYGTGGRPVWVLCTVVIYGDGVPGKRVIAVVCMCFVLDRFALFPFSPVSVLSFGVVYDIPLRCRRKGRVSL